ncbi:14360_t:CDS:2 [Entrophospora sp. SA101]|nr:14360_t:CDS:2 [Entrophospora sp. SA101]CAJ0924374.1 6153_t:CDS:2 [Entrophospora sp. SA101]
MNLIRLHELPISKFIIKRNTKTYITAVNQETLDEFETLIKNTQSLTPLHKIPKHNSLNNLICKIANRKEAQLLPRLISQWRRCLLPTTFQTTKLLFNRLCDEKIESEIHLDKLFKTFGLMTYYDLPQYDPYLFLIILSALMKLNTIESIKRIDITSKEFLEIFLNSEKKIDYSTKNDISVYSFTILQNILELEEIHQQKKVLPTQLHDIGNVEKKAEVFLKTLEENPESLFTSKTSNEVEATVDTTLKEQIIKLNTKLSSKSEKQHHYIEILEKFIKSRGKFFVAEKENQQNFNKQKHIICSNTLNLMTNYYNKLSKLEKRDNIEKYKKILQLNYQDLYDGFKNLKLVWELEYNHNHISSNSSEVKRHCWKCGSEIDYKSLHCERKDCGVIQKALPANINYFEMLNVVDKS